jgi:hypothetical protein
MPANALSKHFAAESGGALIGLAASAPVFGLGSVLASGLVLLFQQFIDALFQRRQIIRDAPRHLLSIRGEFDAADQVWRGLETDVDFSREGFVERILYRARCSAGRSKALRTSAGQTLVLRASARPAFASSFSSRKRRVNTSPSVLPDSSRRDPSAPCARWQTLPAGSGDVMA